MKFNIGDTCSDSVSSFTGIVTTRCEYFDGSCAYELTANFCDGDGKPTEQWFAEARLTRNAEAEPKNEGDAWDA